MTDIRSQFLGLSSNIVYFDNASTTQMLCAAQSAMADYLVSGRSNVGRGLYPPAEASMCAHENARKTIADFLGADPAHFIFTKGVTDGLNAIAFGLRKQIQKGDEILVSPFEHHANFLPWQRIAQERGAILRTMPMTDTYMLDVEGALAMMNDRTRVVAMTMVSNALGTILPVEVIARKAKDFGSYAVIDAAQAVAHLPISFHNMGVDALIIGSHKNYGPAGIGAMAISSRLENVLEPMILGGGMVDRISEAESVWREIPARFEGGSVNVEGAIGFASAIDWISKHGVDQKEDLRSLLVHGLKNIPHITVFDPTHATSIVSFTVEGVHPHDIADMLGQKGICVRAGNHCAVPLMQTIAPHGGTVRVSLATYSTQDEVERFLLELIEVISMLR